MYLVGQVSAYTEHVWIRYNRVDSIFYNEVFVTSVCTAKGGISMSFTHLQVKSGYSLLSSTITIDKLVEQASLLQFDAIALTDEHVLYGVVPFYQACLKRGIKPLIGMSINVINNDQKREQCILLAKNNHGYGMLMKLSTFIQQNKQTGIEKEQLSPFVTDLIGILPVNQSKLKTNMTKVAHEKIAAYVKTWSEMFEPNDFYLGVEDHGAFEEQHVHHATKAFCERYRVSAVAINDVRYLQAEDALAYDCLQSIKKGLAWSWEKAKPAIREHHLRTSLEMEQLFASFWPELLENTEAIRNKCNVTFDLGKRMLPTYPVPNEMNAASYLRQICEKNLSLRYSVITETVRTRLESELDIIESMDFSDYFLIVWDFIKYAKEKNIMVGPGRGSSAGSIVAYILGITEVDPIKYDLLFERFLNPERITMPDIDIDFSDHRRDEVIDYVRNKYGEDRVAQIITFGTFAARSLIRELFKTMDVDRQDAAFILKEIPVQSKYPLSEIIKQSENLRAYIQRSKKLTTLFSIAFKLEGLPRHISTHAAGVVISEQPLVEHVPLTLGGNETNLTQFSMTDLETIGLLKIDFLGLRNLTLIERMLQSINQGTNHHVTLQGIPDNDAKTFELLKHGKTNGVFQLESAGMRRVLGRLKPTEFEDIVAVNALYRPGPMENIPVYIARKHGQEEISYAHPDLQPILEKTYGVLIYQEQIIQIAHKIAGFSYGQADILRRAVSKKKYEVMEEQQEAFVKGCQENGYDRKVAEELFHWIVKFSKYGFPKSHAVAYSKISYQLAYLKAHYPTYFYAELLSSVANQHDKIQMYIKEMKELQIAIAPPSINKSFGKFTVEKACIRIGFLAIKGIGNQAAKEIIRARQEGPFKHLFDFCMRVSFKIINRATLETLIMAGAFDETYSNRASLLASIDQAMEQGELFREFSDQPSFFQDELQLEASYVDMEDFSQVKKLADEKELIGVYISSHPMTKYRSSLTANGYVPLVKLQPLLGERVVKSAVIIQTIKEIRTKRGDPMAFVRLSDETNEIEAVIFPTLYRSVRAWLQEEMIVFVAGKLESRNNRLQLLLSKLEPFDKAQLSRDKLKRLFIKVTAQTNTDAQKVIKSTAEKYPGNIEIVVFYEQTRKTYQLKGYKIDSNPACISELEQFFGKGCVVMQG